MAGTGAEVIREIKLQLPPFSHPVCVTLAQAAWFKGGFLCMKLNEAIHGFTLARSPRWSKATRRNYRQRLAVLENHFGADRDVRTITRTELQKWVLDLMERDERYGDNDYRPTLKGELSPATVHTYVQAACALFGWCAEPEQKLEMTNPAMKLEKPAIPDQPPKAIADNDAEALLEFVEGTNPERDHAIMWMLRSTGGRVGGLAGLTLSDLSLAEGQATVTEKRRRTRVVFLTREAVAAMRRWLMVRPKVVHEFVFTTDTGAPMKTDTIAQMLRRRKKDAGITGRVNPHSWRHGAAKMWIKNGADLATVSALLDHSDSRTTTKYYLRFTRNELAAQHAKFTNPASPEDEKNKQRLSENRDQLMYSELVTDGKTEVPFLRRVK
jgi:site-specific recombinase XerD